MMVEVEQFPFGKTFAVAFVDDTDWADLARLMPVYALFDEQGVRVTKTVWPLRALSRSGSLPDSTGFRDAATLQDRAYSRFCQSLQERGHELALHTASGGDNTRHRTVAAYALFEQTFGQSPSVNVMHGHNRENIYWGRDIFASPVHRAVVGMYQPQRFLGHVESSEFFWGDICKEKTKYVRLLETTTLNTLHADPATPFFDPNKPYVRSWFSSTYAAGSEYFRLMTGPNIDRLRKDRGVAILHTYCVQFTRTDGCGGFRPSPRFVRSLEMLAAQPDGWYVGVTELLDRLSAVRNLTVHQAGRSIALRNSSNTVIRDLAIATPRDMPIFTETRQDVSLMRNASGQVPLGHLAAGATRRFEIGCPSRVSVLAPKQKDPNYSMMFAATSARLARLLAKGYFVPGRTRGLQRQGSATPG